MKKFMTTTALVALLASPALAQDNMADGPFYATPTDTQTAAAPYELRASDLIGKRLYTSEVEFADAETMDVSDDWNDVGEISDILMARDGSAEAVLLDIGGFLGIGERTVAVSMDKLKFVRDGDDADDYFIVVTASQAQLDSAPEFDAHSVDGWRMGDATQPATTTAPAAPETVATTTQADPDMPAAMDDMDKRVVVAATEVNSDALIGARVYDAENEWIGDVSELLISDDGKVNEVVLDIGGFLGMGEHQVAVNMDEIKLMHPEADADDVSVHIAASGDALKNMPEWEGANK